MHQENTVPTDRMLRLGAIAILALAVTFGAEQITGGNGGTAMAADVGSSHGERADRLRRQSRERAKAGLGYETIGHPDDPDNLRIDLEDVGAIISRLGATIQKLEAQRRAASSSLPIIPGLPAASGARDSLSRTYGPAGPTVQSVGKLLAYRLITLGNPNLMVGKVQDRGDHVFATILTRDKSLVAEYAVDKKSGRWRQENSAR